MSNPNSFNLTIKSQSWICDEAYDLCSHGEINLTINGTVITAAGIDEEWELVNLQ